MLPLFYHFTAQPCTANAGRLSLFQAFVVPSFTSFYPLPIVWAKKLKSFSKIDFFLSRKFLVTSSLGSLINYIQIVAFRPIQLLIVPDSLPSISRSVYSLYFFLSTFTCLCLSKALYVHCFSDSFSVCVPPLLCLNVFCLSSLSLPLSHYLTIRSFFPFKTISGDLPCFYVNNLINLSILD